MRSNQYDYSEEADILEIFFERGAATCAVVLADHITLRFRPEEKEELPAFSRARKQVYGGEAS